MKGKIAMGLMAIVFLTGFAVEAFSEGQAFLWNGNHWLQIPADAKEGFVSGVKTFSCYENALKDPSISTSFINENRNISIKQNIQTVDNFYNNNPTKLNTTIIDVRRRRDDGGITITTDFNGKQWQGLSFDGKVAFLKGAGNLADYEAAQKDPLLSLALSDELKNKSPSQLIQDIDSFYRSNPNKMNTSIIAAIIAVEKIDKVKEKAGARELEAFKEKAKTWRALPVKPALPAEANRYRVLAEDAFKSKEFNKAIEYYDKALKVSPLWPQGQFNAALICGETGAYAAAVGHMKRYLELAPEAKDAKAAQEKIFIWEEKAKQ